MPFSTALATPLSNFEANQDMKTVQDPAGACAVCFLAAYFLFLMIQQLSSLLWAATDSIRQ
jgi:hypothetical protein